MKELLNEMVNVGDKFHVSRDIVINIICETINGLNKRYEK